jgi:hypothetical protein
MKMSCRACEKMIFSKLSAKYQRNNSYYRTGGHSNDYGINRFEHLNAKPFMRSLLLAFMFAGCINSTSFYPHKIHETPVGLKNEKSSLKSIKTFEADSWEYFLQNLPFTKGPILDYTGTKISDQQKHYAILPYDVGKQDLQQCADALLRLRAEYLFLKNRTKEIGFHFTGGQFYSFDDYCNGKRPIPKGNDIAFVNKTSVPKNKVSLRNYLDIVYTYAGTISLAKELKTASGFQVGTVVIYAGSPGHCFIITDEAVNEEGEKVFKLVEGYTPAQSIYVLRNLELGNSPWHTLNRGTIRTASYTFTSYKLGKFD